MSAEHPFAWRVLAIVKNATPEVTDRCQDGCHRHVGNSCECHKMGNYYPILMPFGTQTKKNILSFEVTIPGVTIKFQDDHRRHIEN
jgi:hypothetical protein